MYLNEKSWQSETDDVYKMKIALEKFLEIYKELSLEFHQKSLYVPSEEEPYFRSKVYSIQRWLAHTDVEWRRLFLTFWAERSVFTLDDEYEFICEMGALAGGTEAILNNSFVVSLTIDGIWKHEEILGKLYSLNEDTASDAYVKNIYDVKQLKTKDAIDFFKEQLQCIKIMSFEELWNRREELFPHLCFCPSVEKDFEKLDAFCVSQVYKKLLELEMYQQKRDGGMFDSSQLSKTTIESDRTLKEYEEAHTFYDENKEACLATWHMRFTGIAGRIFFEPNYKDGNMLICYIGKKLPTVMYH